MKKISQLFLQGLLAILPVIITLYIVYWLGSLAENTLGTILQLILPKGWYIPGMGIITGFGVVLSIGILLKAYIFRSIVNLIDTLMERTPLIKNIYSSIRDIAKFASSDKENDMQKTVMLTLDNGMKVMGFITRKDINLGKTNNLIAVYVPMSYQIGGFTTFVPETSIETIDMNSQNAMRFILTAAMTEPSTK